MRWKPVAAVSWLRFYTRESRCVFVPFPLYQKNTDSIWLQPKEQNKHSSSDHLNQETDKISALTLRAALISLCVRQSVSGMGVPYHWLVRPLNFKLGWDSSSEQIGGLCHMLRPLKHTHTLFKAVAVVNPHCVWVVWLIPSKLFAEIAASQVFFMLCFL